jgi:hypothetical protein
MAQYRGKLLHLKETDENFITYDDINLVKYNSLGLSYLFYGYQQGGALITPQPYSNADPVTCFGGKFFNLLLFDINDDFFELYQTIEEESSTYYNGSGDLQPLQVDSSPDFKILGFNNNIYKSNHFGIFEINFNGNLRFTNVSISSTLYIHVGTVEEILNLSDLEYTQKALYSYIFTATSINNLPVSINKTLKLNLGDELLTTDREIHVLFSIRTAFDTLEAQVNFAPNTLLFNCKLVDIVKIPEIIP